MRSVRAIVPVLLLLAVILWAPMGCTTSTPTSTSDDGDTTTPADDDGPSTGMPEDDGTEPAGYAWLDIELTDVVTGETFTLRDLEGEPVLIQSFAVW